MGKSWRLWVFWTPLECIGHSEASPELWMGQCELPLASAEWRGQSVVLSTEWRGHSDEPWSPALGWTGQSMAPERWIGHSVWGSLSVSAGTWSGRWSSEEVRRKPVARLLKDAALLMIAKKKQAFYWLIITTIIGTARSRRVNKISLLTWWKCWLVNQCKF